MSNSEDKSKTNGEASCQIVRLGSLKTPRDLSLGGVKPNKKVFTPNLNVIRNKSKGSGSSISVDNKKKDEKGRKDRKHDRNKNYKNGQNIIKSSGVFSEGIGVVQKSQFRSHYGSYAESSAPILRKPTIKSDSKIKVDKESENRKIKIALSCDRFIDNEEGVNFSKLRDIDAPVRIPMGDGGWIPRVKVKKEIDLIVKKEPGVDVDVHMPHQPFVEVKNEPIEDTDLVNLLKRDKPTIIMVQFPLTLPGQGTSTDDNKPRKSQEQDTATERNHKKESKCYLSQLLEGRIGKLQIHRSGRVSIALGDTVLEVSIGTSSSFYEEVVSVSADSDNRTASIVSMSPLIHKMVVYPDWEHLFKDLA